MRVGLARVSTHNRAQDTSIAAQEQQLLDAGCDRVITVRESAFKGPRKGWHELRSLVASGKVTEVLCIDQSRLARDGTDLQFLEECAVQQVVVRALTGGVIETKTVGGFVQAGVFSVMNQAYSRQLGLKVKDGLDRGKAQGRYSCGRVPFGYRYNVESGKVEPHPEDWPKARQMVVDLLSMEMNVSGYVRKFRPGWSPSGVAAWVRKPMLRGIVPNQPDGVQPVFSADEWGVASRLLKHRTVSRSQSTRTVHLLTGLVRCKNCSKNLQYKPGRRGALRLYCANPECDWYSRGVAVPIVRAQLIQVLTAAVYQMQQVIQTANVAKDHEESGECIALKAQLAQLEALRESVGPSLDTALSELKGKIAALQTPTVGPNWEGLAELVAGGLSDATDKELRALVLEYIESITYEGTPAAVNIKLRGTPGSNAEDGSF